MGCGCGGSAPTPRQVPRQVQTAVRVDPTVNAEVRPTGLYWNGPPPKSK